MLKIVCNSVLWQVKQNSRYNNRLFSAKIYFCPKSNTVVIIIFELYLENLTLILALLQLVQNI